MDFSLISHYWEYCELFCLIYLRNKEMTLQESSLIHMKGYEYPFYINLTSESIKPWI